MLKLLLTNKEILNPDKLNNFTTVFSMTTNQSALHADLLKDIIDEVNYEEMLFPVVGLIEFKNTLFNTTLQNFFQTHKLICYLILLMDIYKSFLKL